MACLFLALAFDVALDVHEFSAGVDEVGHAVDFRFGQKRGLAFGGEEGEFGVHGRSVGRTDFSQDGIALIGRGELGELVLLDFLVEGLLALGEFLVESGGGAAAFLERLGAVLLCLSLGHDLGSDVLHARLHLFEEPDFDAVVDGNVLALGGREAVVVIEFVELGLHPVDLAAHIFAELDFIGFARNVFELLAETANGFGRVLARLLDTAHGLLGLVELAHDELDAGGQGGDEDANAGRDERALDGDACGACGCGHSHEGGSTRRRESRPTDRKHGSAHLGESGNRLRAKRREHRHDLCVESRLEERHRGHHSENLGNHLGKNRAEVDCGRGDRSEGLAEPGEVGRV